MLGKCTLNNKSMRNIRKDKVYQCLVIDLCLLNVITREECELLIGSGIPSGLCLPDGSTVLPKEEYAETVEDDTVNTEDVEDDPVEDDNESAGDTTDPDVESGDAN